MNKVMVSNNLKQDSTFQKQKMFKKMKKWNIDLRIIEHHPSMLETKNIFLTWK